MLGLTLILLTLAIRRSQNSTRSYTTTQESNKLNSAELVIQSISLWKSPGKADLDGRRVEDFFTANEKKSFEVSQFNMPI